MASDSEFRTTFPERTQGFGVEGARDRVGEVAAHRIVENVQHRFKGLWRSEVGSGNRGLHSYDRRIVICRLAQNQCGVRHLIMTPPQLVDGGSPGSMIFAFNQFTQQVKVWKIEPPRYP